MSPSAWRPKAPKSSAARRRNRRAHQVRARARRQDRAGSRHQDRMNNPQTRARAVRLGADLRADPKNEVRERLKLLMLDSLGCALYGAELQWSRILQRHARRARHHRGVRGVGHPRGCPRRTRRSSTARRCRASSSTTFTARACCMSARSCCRRCSRSPRAERGLSGREFLTAAVAGYEIGPRVGLCMGPEHIGQGWHSGATLGVFSAAAGAARGAAARRGADGARARHRRHAGGRADGGAIRRHGQAHARRPLVAERALRRAARGGGFTGIVDVFESEYGGFCTTFSRSHDRFD